MVNGIDNGPLAWSQGVHEPPNSTDLPQKPSVGAGWRAGEGLAGGWSRAAEGA